MDSSREGSLRILVAAGGTGGHIFPALSVMEVISKRYPGAEFTWLGSSHRMESRLITAKGIDFIGLRQTEFRRRPTPGNVLYNFRTLWFLLRSIFQSIGIVRKLRPRMVLCTGGFAAGAAGIAAWLTRTPLVIIEPNVYPGMTNRWLGKRASLVFTAYPEAQKYFPKDRTFAVGAPSRTEVMAKNRDDSRRALNLGSDTLMVLATGGSQGAKSINKILPDAAMQLRTSRPEMRFRIFHQCGAGKSGSIAVNREILPESDYEIVEFIEDMPTYLAAVDIVISRAGASTLSEIGCRGLPSVLIPYPESSENHQVRNARAWEAAGAAFCIEESELSPSRLAEALSTLLSDTEKRASMGSAAKQFGNPSAAAEIVDHLKPYLETKSVS